MEAIKKVLIGRSPLFLGLFIGALGSGYFMGHNPIEDLVVGFGMSFILFFYFLTRG